MSKLRSRINARGQLPVPAEVQKRLGLGPGALVEWVRVGDGYLVRATIGHTSRDVHAIAFDSSPARRELAELKEGVRVLLRKKHPRRG